MPALHMLYRRSHQEGLVAQSLARAIAFLLALLLLGGCGSGQPGAARQATATLPGVPAATPLPTGTATSMPGPTPVAGLLDPVPTSCAITAPPQTMQISGITLVGSSPVWIRGPYYPTTLHLDQLGYMPWPGTKIIWEIGPNYSQAVTVQVKNLQTGALAWWGEGSDRPPGAGQTLMLDPNHPSGSGPDSDHGAGPGGLHEWGTYVYLLASGCYALQVSWPGGSWRGVFAAGR